MQNESVSTLNFEYVGGGYYRLKGVPKGKSAPIIHGPELLKIAQQLEETVRKLEGKRNESQGKA